jgi:hypothetical protein
MAQALRGTSEEASGMPVVALVTLAFEVVAAPAAAGTKAAATTVTSAATSTRARGRDVGVTAIGLVRGPGIPRDCIGRVAQDLDVFSKISMYG